MFFGLIFVMLGINIFLTYFFKLVFHPRIFKVRYNSTRYILTASCVFFLNFFFLGYLPEYFMGSSIYSLDRTWYLKAGVVYTMYFLFSLILHPLESLVYFLFVLIRRKVQKSKKVIQKDLNKLYVGREFDYSHKIGRLLAHTLIAFHHGSGLPALYLLNAINLVIFVNIEKALVLRFYRKMEIVAPYIRQYLIHCILLVIMFHCFRSIDLLGSEDIFPTSYVETIGLKSGTLLYYYVAEPMDYTDRMVSVQGIGYLILAILVFIFYVLIWWSHRIRCLKKILGCVSLLNHSPRRPIQISTLRDRNLGYKPDTYIFSKHPKYEVALPNVEQEFGEHAFGDNRPSSPDKSAVDSQYGLKSEPNNSDDDVLNKNKGPVYNIYRNPDTKNDIKRVNSVDSNEDSPERLEDI